LVGDLSSPAVIYAKFTIIGILEFKITGPDVWAVYGLSLGEVVTQNEPIVIENSGGVVLDFGFYISDEDIITIPGSVPWESLDSWMPTNTPSRYTLGLIICDGSVTSGPGMGEFANDDILEPDSLTWYTTSGQFRPFSAALVYAHEGVTSLGILSADGMDKVHSFFRLQISRAGSEDDYPHAAQITITGRISSG